MNFVVIQFKSQKNALYILIGLMTRELLSLKVMTVKPATLA